MRTRLALGLGICVAAAGCRSARPPTFGPEKVDIPVTDGLGGPSAATPAKRSATMAPPPSGVAKESPFPAVHRTTLANGMGVDVVTSAALPIVHLRVLVRAGSGSGGIPGVGELTARMLKDGGTRALASADLLRRIETMGASLGVSVDQDRTVLSLAVTKDQLPEAVSLLAQIVREPRFDEGELRKLRARSSDAAEDTARSSGSWTATWLVFRELFGDAGHPYGTYGLLPSQIAQIDGSKVREFHRRFYVPRSTTLVLAGDVEATTAQKLAETSFGAWQGGAPPAVAPAPPRALARRVVVAHRPKSVQSDVYVAMVAPERRSPAWASLRVANQVLGGGVASRLFTDVREQRSLAYRTSAQILELAHGPQPLVLYAGTETGKTALAVSGLLENAARMTSAPPTSAETETARRYLSDVFSVRMETIGAIADMVVAEESLGLPHGYWDTYRKELRATTADAAARAAKALYSPETALVVVAGDADVVGPPLASFGEVTVVDPEKEFKVMRTLPKAATR